MGRFGSRDLIGYVGGIDLYWYATNNPGNNGDPTGMSCEKPEGVQYIPGRGGFETFQAQPGGTIFDPPKPGTIQADFWAKWKADSKKFGDKSCCCCNEIGWVQIIKPKATWTGPMSWITPDKGIWKLDGGGIPYGAIIVGAGAPPTRGNPCTLTTPIAIGDYPARPKNALFSTLLAFDWEAEDCVICLSGQEGPRTETIGHLGWVETKLRGIAVYGCGRWSWSAKRTAAGAYDENVTTNGWDLAPSQAMIDAISAYYYRADITVWP